MPRKPRELVDEGIYHVFNRGNDRRELFPEKDDYYFFLKQLSEAKAKTKTDIYHYCLMTNHFHLLVRVNAGKDLPRFMHLVQLGYARYFKKKYLFVGHIFQERFRSPRISQESYYLQCGRYIERNPVKAGLVREASDYPFSSASFYALGRKDDLITPNLYYFDMGNSDEIRRENYRKFLLIDEPYSAIVDAALIRV